MGQYFTLVNLDKKQFIYAHAIGNGLKIGEQTGWKYSTEQVAKLLLAEPDLASHSLIGAWRGDTRVGFVGDYGDTHPAPGVAFPDELLPRATELYDADQLPDWTDISVRVREMMTAVFGITYSGDGWLDINEPDGAKVRPSMRPDLILSTRPTL